MNAKKIFAVLALGAVAVTPAYAWGDTPSKPTEEQYKHAAFAACVSGWKDDVLRGRPPGFAVAKLREMATTDATRYGSEDFKKGRYVEGLGWTIEVQCYVETDPFRALSTLPEMRAEAWFTARAAFTIKDDGFERYSVVSKIDITETKKVGISKVKA